MYFFKLVNTTVQLDQRLIESKNVEPLKQRSHIYERPTYNLYSEFWLCRGLVALTPMLFKDQLCFILGEYFPHFFSKSIQIFSIQFHKIFLIFPSLDYSLSISTQITVCSIVRISVKHFVMLFILFSWLLFVFYYLTFHMLMSCFPD